MAIIEPWPIKARWRRCEDIRNHAMTMSAKGRKAYLKKVIADYIDWLVSIGVAPEKIERERRDFESMLRMPPTNGGARLRRAA